MWKFLLVLWLFINIAYVASDRVCGVGKHSMPMSKINFPILERNIEGIFRSKGFAISPNRTEMHNNGKTVIIKLFYKNNYAFTSSGPYGNDTYKLELLYFNWLKKSQTPKGTLPIELHVVFRNEKYKTFEIASKKNFGMTVWSFRYNSELSKKSESMVKYMFRALSTIREPNTTTFLTGYKYTIHSPLLPYLMNISTDYYVYLGRLSPFLHPCSGDVIWLEFPSYVQIYTKDYKNIKQLKSFNNKFLMDQVYESISPDGPIFYNRDRSLDYNGDDNYFEGFNATSNDDYEEVEGINGTNNIYRKGLLNLMLIFGIFICFI